MSLKILFQTLGIPDWAEAGVGEWGWHEGLGVAWKALALPAGGSW